MRSLTRFGLVLAVATGAGAQQPISIQHIRPMDQRGVNMYEPSKHDTVTFAGTRIAFGGSFRQDFQGLDHSNGNPTAPPGSDCNTSTSANAVAPGSVVAGQQAVWNVFRVRVNDSAGTIFQQQGFFAP